MDNDKQDQGAAPTPASNSAYPQNQTKQPISSNNTTTDINSPVPSPFNRTTQPSTSRPKKPLVKIIIAIVLALVLIAGGVAAFIHLSNPNRIIREALEADVDKLDRAAKYEVEIKTRLDAGAISFDSIKLKGEANLLGQKRQGSGTVNIGVIDKGKALELGKIDLVTKQNKIYLKLDNSLVSNYIQLAYGSMGLATQGTKQSISEDSPDIEASTTISQSGQLQSLTKTLIDVLTSQWIELDPSQFNISRTNRCAGTLTSAFSKREARLELIKIITEGKFLDIRNAGAENGNTIYQVSLNADAWAEIAKKLEGTTAYKDLYKCLSETSDSDSDSDSDTDYDDEGSSTTKCIDGIDGTKCGGEAQTIKQTDNKIDGLSSAKAIDRAKLLIRQSGFSAKLWVKGSLIGKHQITKFNVKTRLPRSRNSTSTTDSKIDLTIEWLDRQPKVTIPDKSTTIDQLQKSFSKLSSVSL